MIKIIYKKRFLKSFAKQTKKIQKKAMDTIDIFEQDQYHASLRRHFLKGKKYNEYESIDVTGDIRIIIKAKTLEIVDIYDLGSHAKLYG